MTAPLPLRVLVVDDEKNIRSTLKVCLEGLGCEVLEADRPEAALAQLSRGFADLAFVDLRLGTASGLDLVPRLLAEDPELEIVLITAHAAFETAVEAIRRGARDYLPKPFTPAQVRHVVERTREHRAISGRVRDLEGQLKEVAPEVYLETASASMRQTLALVSRAAASNAAVLLRGENGTGKGVLARVLHSQSPRRERPFLTVNCPLLSEQLLASELFGHVRGAFTGATRDQPGRVELAEGGTLFLDEVSEMAPGLQAKLLRFLQDRQFERVGEGKTRTADVRVVAATNRDLEVAVAEGRFREDLFYRLNVIEVRVPALRERTEDILPLAHGFLRFFGAASGRPVQTLSKEAEAALLKHRWPGNTRELRNAIERAVIVWPAAILDAAAFALPTSAVAASSLVPGADVTIERLEREHVLRVLARTGSLDEAAQVLGIDVSTLYRKRKKYESEGG
jgi:NtrC-family two-component system response regulator AlgB